MGTERPKILMEGLRRRARGFSLLELLVAVTILASISVALMIILNQTQRVLRGSTSQVDVIETGRAILDLIEREMSELPRADDVYPETPVLVITLASKPLVQDLPGQGVSRTNVLQDVFFLTRRNRQWRAIGYKVWITNEHARLGAGDFGVGDLYRFEYAWKSAASRWENAINTSNALYFFTTRTPADLSAFRRVASGVVHFCIRPYFDPSWTNSQDWLAGVLVEFHPGLDVADWVVVNKYYLPVIEVELGVLDPVEADRVASQISLPVPDTAIATRVREYLKNKSASVHLFKRMISF